MKITQIIILLLTSTVFFYCKTKTNTFDLNRDIANFSELMTELDTLVIKTNLCICSGEHYEKDIITKSKDSVFIQVFINNDIKGSMAYEKRSYAYIKSDTLNFESLYSKMQKLINPSKNGTLRFEIVHNRKDTLKLYSYGLMNSLAISKHLYKIKDRIYFNKDYYKLLKIPKKPKGLSEIEKLDSILRADTEKKLQDLSLEEN